MQGRKKTTKWAKDRATEGITVGNDSTVVEPSIYLICVLSRRPPVCHSPVLGFKLPVFDLVTGCYTSSAFTVTSGFETSSILEVDVSV